MESINHLLSNEKILWEISHRVKFDERLRYLSLIAVIIFLNLVFISPLVQFGGSSLTFFMLEIGILLNIISIAVTLFSFLSTRRDMKKGQLTWKDLYKYETKCVLTDKRWIQKSLDVSQLKDTNYLIGDIEHYKDFALIKLDLIKHIEITEYKEFGKMKYVLSLYFSYDKTLPKKVFLGIHFTSEDQFQILINTIKKVMEVKREEKLHRKSGSNVYDFYF
jgi:hypothetical protein